MIKIFLIDESISFKTNLKSALKKEMDISIVGENLDGQNPVPDILETKPNIILIDIKDQEESRFDLLFRIRKKYSEGNIIVLTNCLDRIYITKDIQVGIKAYLLKEKHTTGLIKYIRKVMLGEKYFPDKIGNIYMDFTHNILVDEKVRMLLCLETMEYEILKLLKRGEKHYVIF
jgi:DNA-binding NarL/FixJ family response regulator